MELFHNSNDSKSFSLRKKIEKGREEGRDQKKYSQKV